MDCDERLKQRIRDNLARFAVEERGDHTHRSAAVAITVADEGTVRIFRGCRCTPNGSRAPR